MCILIDETEFVNKYIMLTLDFNEIKSSEAQFIIDETVCFFQNVWDLENSKMVSYDSKGKSKIIKKIEISEKMINPSFTIEGHNISDKKSLIKKLNQPIKMCNFYNNENSIDALLLYLENDKINVDNALCESSFEISFNRFNFEKVGPFECQIKINLKYAELDRKKIVKKYMQFLDKFSSNKKLFAAYIDFDYGTNYMLYEYCYDALLESEDKFERLRTFSWAGYISKELLEQNGVLESIAKEMTLTKKDYGYLFCADCDIEKFVGFQRKKIYEAFKSILPKSYGMIPIEHLIYSGFKPCDSIAYLFEEFGNKYVCFSNGFSLEQILELEPDVFKFVKTIIIKNTGDGTMCSVEE